MTLMQEWIPMKETYKKAKGKSIAEVQMTDQKAETIGKIQSILTKNPVLIAGTMGFDKKPQLHKAELCFEENDIFYFTAAKCETYYGEISTYPELVLGTYDPESGTLLRLRGQPVFVEERTVVERCIASSPALRKRWGEDPDMLIAYFLKDLTAELLHDDGTTEEAVIGTPENVLVGISMKKDKELKDRLSRLMERREAEKPELPDEEALHRQKLYDGTLLYFAEKAKELWPRLDIQPAERSVLFETYDEREEYVSLARKRLGNARIEKPEDLTYWLGDSSLDT